MVLMQARPEHRLIETVEVGEPANECSRGECSNPQARRRASADGSSKIRLIGKALKHGLY